MSAKVFEGAISKVSERWLPNILGSPLLFWVGVFLLYIYSLENNWQDFFQEFSTYDDSKQLVIVGLALSAIIASDFIVRQFEFPCLRILEGYWFAWTNPLRKRLIRYWENYQNQLEQDFSKLDTQKELTADESQKLIKLITQLERLPLNVTASHNPDLMPTRLGNILRAYERKPTEKYGLDAIVCWSRLWLLLPDPVKLDLTSARSDLNSAVRLWIWGILFATCGWLLNPIAIPIGLLVAVLAYYFWMLPAAQVYGILIDATFDTHRHLLYEALRFPQPESPKTEAEQGQQLTQYLLGTFRPDSFQKPTD
ncbi:hypothetical protein [Sodalinema gerasimenkoae]|uniref:hypothetical protein n=1 Tax=Sodalinema gerasimenkoae TaxID=2862348 RepID=UPI00135A3630|nr:hypothetical protein [Sodalinema gerasimenkoae]